MVSHKIYYPIVSVISFTSIFTFYFKCWYGGFASTKLQLHLFTDDEITAQNFSCKTSTLLYRSQSLELVVK